MKILFVTGIFPPDRGGPASYVPRMARALTARGHSAEVVCLSDSLDHDDSARGFRVKRISRRMFWPLRLAATTFAIWRAALRHDVVYINGLGSEAALAAILAGRPAVHKIVGDYAWERAVGKGWFRGTIDEYQTAPKTLALRFADCIRTWPRYFAREIVVPSRYLARIVRGWGMPEEKIRIIYNAVEQVATRSCDVLVGGSSRGVLAARSVCAIGAGGGDAAATTLITVCRLVPWKGIDPLIRVLAELPHVRLVIAGDGVLRAELEATAASCGVAARVVFLGDVPHHEVPAHLAQADAFILNSTYEGLPHVILEAMAAGLPVIATDAGGTGEVVEHEATGLLVPIGDSTALKTAIERLARDPELRARLTAEATRRMREHFDFETMIRETEAALLSTIQPACEMPAAAIGETR